MFKKTTPPNQNANLALSEQEVILAPQYFRPKMLLVDLEDGISEALKAEGFNVSVGSFGTPYKVAKTSDYVPVVGGASLPNYTEQEIVVIDLALSNALDGPSADKHVPNEELDWWAKCQWETVDPRPRAMAALQNHSDRILHNGGCFVIFAEPRFQQELILARVIFRRMETERTIPYNNWSVLSVLSDIEIEADSGREVQIGEGNGPIYHLLANHLRDAEFTCTIAPDYRFSDKFISLAKNKYGSTVAAAIVPADDKSYGLVFIFPHLSNKAAFLVNFFKNVLPDLRPALFPYAEGQLWVHRDDYELPTVRQKRRNIAALREDLEKRVADLEANIETEKSDNQYLYDLLRGTGEPLVEAVKKAFQVIGFTSVIDVDEEMKQQGKENSLREDLRIHDQSPTLVIDIKGIGGHPADSEAMQSQKHASIRIQEWKRTDVRALTIINHQRHLPPLDRDNTMPYRQEILDYANDVQMGLMTSWDLFRLMRGCLRNGWQPEFVKPLFYGTGRILPLPTHYAYLGKVKQVWKHAFSIEIEDLELNEGDYIAIEFPTDYDEQKVKSLRLNDEDVKSAGIGNEVGISRDEKRDKIKVGLRIFLSRKS